MINKTGLFKFLSFQALSEYPVTQYVIVCRQRIQNNENKKQGQL